jgi:hypothetical protein
MPGMPLSGLKLLSIAAFLVLLTGYTLRRRKAVHIPLMLTALAIDLGIVVYIEVQRGAIAAAKARMGPLMAVHIAISVAVLVLYGVQVASGIRKARGGGGRRHGASGTALLWLRFGNLVTSFVVS